MKVIVDRAKCVSNGMCAALAPNYFSISDDGTLVILQENAAEQDAEVLREAELSCPSGAIGIDKSESKDGGARDENR